MDVQGKKVIVTGGVKGLGREIVDLLLKKNASVAVFDVDREGLQKLGQEVPDVHCVECDLTDHNKVGEAVAACRDEFGVPDVLVNNAGFLYSAPLVRIGPDAEKHDPDMWQSVLNVNLSSVFNMTRCVAENMIKNRTKGVIVNISSVSAEGTPGQSAYAAAKAGVNALTAVWAKELGPMGIRVAAVAPGFSDTESTHQVLSESALRDTVSRVPLRRLGKPEEIAAGVVAAIENDFFNGKVMALDGGLTM